MPQETQDLRASPQHVGALAAVRDTVGMAAAADISTDADIAERSVRLASSGGEILAAYERHAEMFTIWDVPSGTYLGCIDAPWSEHA